MKPAAISLSIMLIMLSTVAWGDEASHGITLSGFVNADLMLDSRQTVSAREGHFLLYPAAESPDANGDDINARANMNMLAIRTRLKGSVSGPQAFGAKTTGVIEGAFFGHSDGDVNGFRLRHAFVNMDWNSTHLIMGQYWHPMFVTDVFPGTVSFNTGAPFQPFSRNPQVRVTRNMGGFDWTVAAMSQRDFASTGPDGTSSKYLRNALVPNLHAQIRKRTETVIVGAGVDWKSLAPNLSYAGYRSTETVSSLSLMGYAKFVLPSVTMKVEGVLGQNLTDHLMLGGYAVESMDDATGEIAYTPTKVLSIWSDISFGKDVEGGLFAGYTKNQGAVDDISGAFYGRGSDIDMIYRIAPRLILNSGKTRIAAELEYTAAAYGQVDSDGTVRDAETVGNTRLLLSTFLFF